MVFSNTYQETPDSGFQFLENLATAYWYSEVLFTAIELNLFDLIELGNQTPESLAVASNCNTEQLHRLMKLLQGIGLLEENRDCWHNSQAARRFLISDSPQYMGNFLLYRKYIQNTWQDITAKLSRNADRKRAVSAPSNDYESRNFYYVRAMDEIARLKAEEIAALFADTTFTSPILDIGGGAGTLLRTILRKNKAGTAVLFDLPEVIRAAKILYPEPESWTRIQTLEGDFIHHEFSENRQFGTIILSNFLHVYDPDTAKQILQKSVRLLQNNGTLLIHDYFPDRTSRHPHKGLLYDLNMMLNTYNGVCHSAAGIAEWLKELGAGQIQLLDLPSDSSIIFASINSKIV